LGRVFVLWKVVEEEGGYKMMAQDGKWLKVATQLGYQAGKHVAGNLRQHYEKLLYPYDVFMAGAPSEEKEVQSLNVCAQSSTSLILGW
jgi:histone demethylase JARID1